MAPDYLYAIKYKTFSYCQEVRQVAVSSICDIEIVLNDWLQIIKIRKALQEICFYSFLCLYYSTPFYIYLSIYLVHSTFKESFNFSVQSFWDLLPYCWLSLFWLALIQQLPSLQRLIIGGHIMEKILQHF